MSIRYTADLALAADVVATLVAVSGSLEEISADLRWRVAQMPEVFEGEAALAFLARHADWESSYDEVGAALASMRRALATARSNYHCAGAANVELWRSVQ